MGSFSNNVENAVLGKLFKRTAWADVTIWIGACTSDTALTDHSTGGYSEPTAASYGRQDASTSTWNSPADGSIDNAAAIEFTTAVQSWCSIYGFVACDASVGGNKLFCGTLATPRDITAGDALRFPAGSIVVRQD